MAISLVGSITKKDGFNGSTGTSLATAGIAVTTGNLLVVSIQINNPSAITITGITDTAGNDAKYIQVSRVRETTMISSVDVWYAENVTGNASNAVTVNFSGSAGYAYIYVAQFSGVATSSSLDQAATGTNTGVGTTVNTSAFTTTQADEVLFAAGYYNSADTITYGYTNSASDTPSRTLVEYEIVSSIQTGVTASYSSTSTLTGKIIAAGTFKAAGGAAAVVHKLPALGAGA